MTAGAELEDGERQARRRRLLVIVLVGAIGLGAFQLWGRSVNKRDKSHVAAATAELKSAFQSVDLPTMQAKYAVSQTQGRGADEMPGLPTTHESQMMRLQFEADQQIVAEYRVKGATQKCVSVVVTGPVPNTVLVRNARCQ